MTGNDQILLTHTNSLILVSAIFAFSHTHATPLMFDLERKVAYSTKCSSFTHTLSHGTGLCSSTPSWGKAAPLTNTQRGRLLMCKSFLIFLSFPLQALLAHPSLHMHLMAHCSTKFSMTQRLLWRWGQPVFPHTFSLAFSSWAQLIGKRKKPYKQCLKTSAPLCFS